MANFREVSDATRYPGAYIEIDGTMAGLGEDIPRVLLVGQKLPDGTAPAGEIIKLAGVENAVTKAGAGSMLAQMARAYRKGDPVFELYMLPYSDLPAGVQATGTITVSSAPTASGVIALYIADRIVNVGVTDGMTPAAVATAIAAAITAASVDIPVTATAETDTVTLTARHKGTCGNDIDVRLSIEGEEIPVGLVLSISAMSGGAGNPEPGDLAAILGTRWYRYIALGINDSSTVRGWHEESQRRYRAQPVQAGFRIFTAIRGDYVTVSEFGESKNYEHIGMLGLGINPTSTWEAAAQLAAAAAPSLYNNPVRSTEDIQLVGMRALSYFDWSQSNSLLFSGISVMSVSDDGSCYIKRLISMYQRRPDDTADDAFLDLNTAEVMERIRYTQRVESFKRFRGTVAAKSSEGFRPGLQITTVDEIRAFLLSIYKNLFMREFGWVQEFEYYKNNLVVTQDTTNPNRFNFWDKPIINSPFYILAGRSQFLRALPFDAQG